MKTTKPILTTDKVLETRATCEVNLHYTRWEIDRLAIQSPAICEVCERQTLTGWECLDGGGIYCDDCIIEADQAGELIGKLEDQLECLAIEKTALITALQNTQEAHKKNVDNLTYWEEKAAELKTDNQRLNKVVGAQNYTIERGAQYAKNLTERINDNCYNCEKGQ